MKNILMIIICIIFPVFSLAESSFAEEFQAIMDKKKELEQKYPDIFNEILYVYVKLFHLKKSIEGNLDQPERVQDKDEVDPSLVARGGFGSLITADSQKTWKEKHEEKKQKQIKSYAYMHDIEKKSRENKKLLNEVNRTLKECEQGLYDTRCSVKSRKV